MGDSETTVSDLAEWGAKYVMPALLLAVIWAQVDMYWDFYGSGGRLDTIKLDQCPQPCKSRIQSIDTKLNRILTELLEIRKGGKTGSLPLDRLEGLDGEPSDSAVPDHYFDHDISTGADPDSALERAAEQDDSADRGAGFDFGGSSSLSVQPGLERDDGSAG